MIEGWPTRSIPASTSDTSISRSPTSTARSPSTTAFSASRSRRAWAGRRRSSQRRRLSPSHRPEYLGEPQRPAAARGDDGAVSRGHPLSRSRGARRRAAPAGRRARAARRRVRSRRQRSALPARSGRQRPRAVLGSPDATSGRAPRTARPDDDRAPRRRRAARGRTPPESPHRRRRRGARAALRATRARGSPSCARALLALHKALLDDAKVAYEMDRGRIPSDRRAAAARDRRSVVRVAAAAVGTRSSASTR